MLTTSQDLRRVALREFAAAGYHGTSIQLIAERAGVSKASVLYHYTSKEQLLEAVLSPALDALDEVLLDLDKLRGTSQSRGEFLERFVDFLLVHRLAVHVFVNQSASLTDVPVIDRARDEIRRIAAYFEQRVGSVDEKVRFGVALGGAAYLLAQPVLLEDGADLGPDEAVRPALLRILGELLAPTSN
jgi:TetR/AcrR family transcriptional regulator